MFHNNWFLHHFNIYNQWLIVIDDWHTTSIDIQLYIPNSIKIAFTINYWSLVNGHLGIWHSLLSNDLLEWVPNNSFQVCKVQCPKQQDLVSYRGCWQTYQSAYRSTYQLIYWPSLIPVSVKCRASVKWVLVELRSSISLYIDQVTVELEMWPIVGPYNSLVDSQSLVCQYSGDGSPIHQHSDLS